MMTHTDDKGHKAAHDNKPVWSNEHPHAKPVTYYGEGPIDTIHNKRDKAPEHHPPQAFM